MNRLVDIFNHQNFIIMKIGIRSFVQFTGKNKVYQSVALFLQKCVKTHLLASVTPQKIFRLANARHEARTLPPQYFCQVYAYAYVYGDRDKQNACECRPTSVQMNTSHAWKIVC